MYLDKTASVQRLQALAGNADKEDYQAVGNYGAVRINIQPASAELTAVTDGVYGQTFRAFVSVSGVRVGDRITVSGSNVNYIVKGVQNNIWGPLPHLELVLFKGDL